MNREGAPGKSPEEMYIQQKVRVLLMLRKMGSNVSARGQSSAVAPACSRRGRGGDAEPAVWLCGRFRWH